MNHGQVRYNRSDRPSPCWSLRFEVLTTAGLELPMENAKCVLGPDHDLDYGSSIDEVCPQQFLSIVDSTFTGHDWLELNFTC